MKYQPLDLPNGRVTILGGTGTLGQALAARILEEVPRAQITIFSRDEHKQALMKRKFPKCSYVLGDIRDENSYHGLLVGRDIVFHVAALKHVDLLESAPMESIKTNVLATDSLARSAVEARVPHFVFSSTDKAVDPINTYGYSKALSEKILFHHNDFYNSTRFSVYRWGNVLGSQGSVIPYFVQTLLTEKKAYVTHEEMSRFWIPIEWAVDFMLQTYTTAHIDRAMVPRNMKTAKVTEIISAIATILDVKDYSLETIGFRKGEKMHEVMHSQHSSDFLSSETHDRYELKELIEMLHPLVGKYLKAAA